MSADGFKDQVVLVTGGSRGIGRAAAALFGQAGATVAITYKSRKPEADALVEELSHQGREAMAVQADFADSAAPGIAVEAAVKRWGRLDVLVNNAGLTRDTLVMRMSEADWDIVIQTNLRAAFLASKAALRRGGGGECRAGELQRLQSRLDRSDQGAGQRGRFAEHHGECRRSGLHRDRAHQRASG